MTSWLPIQVSSPAALPGTYLPINVNLFRRGSVNSSNLLPRISAPVDVAWKTFPELKLRHNLSSDKSVGSTPEIVLYYVAEESNMSEITSLDKTSGTSGTATVRALDKSFAPPSSQQKLREARIVELREQYESGKYLVDAAKVSAAIVGQHINVLA